MLTWRNVRRLANGSPGRLSRAGFPSGDHSNISVGIPSTIRCEEVIEKLQRAGVLATGGNWRSVVACRSSFIGTLCIDDEHAAHLHPSPPLIIQRARFVTVLICGRQEPPESEVASTIHDHPPAGMGANVIRL